jgi:hypothetical protein
MTERHLSYPNHWTVTTSPALFLDSSVLTLNFGEDTKCKCLLLEPVRVLIIKWVWRAGRDERLFYLFPDHNTIYLDEIDDMKWLPAFGGLIKSYDKNTDSVEVDLNIFGNIPATPPSEIPVIAELRSNGGYSYHFGHFIIETVPYLFVASRIGCKLLTYLPINKWQSDILGMVQKEDLNAAIAPYQDNPSASIMRGSSRVEATLATVRFFKISKRDTNSLISYMYKEHGLNSCNIESKIIYVLSRRNDVPTSTGAIRWSNEADLLSSCSEYTFQAVSPERCGLKNLYDMVQSEQPALVISTNGSAIYQFFLYQGYCPKLLMLLGNVSSAVLWTSQMKNFQAFCDKFWILRIDSQETGDWNEEFHYPPKVILDSIRHIFSGSSDCAIFENKFVLHPPRAADAVASRT